MRRNLAAAMLAGLIATTARAQTPPAPTPSTFMPPITVADPAPDGVRVDKDGVFANFFPGHGEGRRPAILLLGGSEGGLGPGAARMARSLAAEGFSVLQLCYFGCPGTPPQLVSVPMESFSRGLGWLRAQPGVDAARIAVVGGSKGAEAGLLVASREKGLKAVVVGMPSNVAWPGISYTADMKPGWTVEGRPVPALPYAIGAIRTGGILALYKDALPDLPQHPDAAIPVERIEGPIMLVCGEADNLWPSCPMSDLVAARLKAEGRPAPALLRYADAGHGVFGVPVEQGAPGYTTLGALGGTAEGNAAARKDAWPKTIAFLKAALHP